MGVELTLVPSAGPRRSYVVAGATIQCTCGSHPSTLSLPQNYNVYIKGKALMTTWDNAGIIHIGEMGSCRGKGNAPCAPAFLMRWQNGNDRYLVKGERPALLNTSTIVCLSGGVVTITKNGQT